MNIDKDKNNADLAALLRELPKKRDQMEVIKVLSGLQGLERISGREVLDYVRGYVDVKKEDPDFEFKDYAEMAQFGSKNTLDGIMAKPGPKPAPAKPPINKADLKSVSIQLGLADLFEPAKEPSVELVEEARPLPISKKPTIVMPPAELPTAPPKTLSGTVTKHLTSQYRYAPTSSKDMGGGMGSVIPYKDKALDREVIRKKPKLVDEDGNSLSLEKLADDLAVFEREMRISGSLVHANIPPVYEAGIDKRDGTPYFDMLKIVGKPLNDVIDLVRKGRKKTAEAKEYTLQRRVQIFADICRAMAYSHSKKIVHRDLKPGNVMIGDNKVTYVIDWGLAKHLDDAEDEKLGGKAKSQKEIVNQAAGKEEMYQTLDEGMIKGTISYMAPEQARAELIDEKSDQYTLGTILYELATLEDFRPFLAKTPLEKVIMIGKGTYPFIKPRKIRPETPTELESIILKATQFDKRKRYPSVQHMLDDVEAYLTGGYVGAHDYGFVESWAKRVRNNPIKTVAGGLAAIALAGIVSVYGVMSGRVAYNQLIAAEADAKANKESSARELAERDAKVKAAEADAATQKQKAAESEAKRKEAELALAKEREKGQNVAQNILSDGDRLIKDKGDFAGAIAKYADAIKESRGSWNEPYYKRGLAHYNLFNATSAIEDFIEANRISEEKTNVADIRALYYAALVNLDLLDRFKTATTRWQFPAAIDFFKKVVEKAPDKESGYAKLSRSAVAFSESRFEEAYQLALEAEIQNPRMWEAKCLLAQYELEWIPTPFNELGMRKFRNYKRALERLEDALEIEKDQIRCMILKPEILLALGWSKEALDEAEKLIRIRSDVPNFHYFKGLAHQHLGQNEKALEEFGIAEDLDKPFAKYGKSIRHEICTFRGLVYFGQKDYDRAEAELDEALKSNEWAQAYSYRGVVRSMKQNFEGALQDHNKALALQPDFAQGYSARGRTYRYMGQTENAINDYRTAIKKGYEVARLEMGEYFLALNRNKEAEIELEKYLANPDNKQQRELAQRLLDKAKGK